MNSLKFGLTVFMLSVILPFTFGQDKAKKPKALVGATSVIDYKDTFKLNPQAVIKEVKNAKMQDGVSITILLDGKDKGKKIVLKENEPFSDYFINHTLRQTEGWVNPGKDFSRAFVDSKGYHVEIRVTGRKEVFYGILEFNKVYETCAGDPSARSYFIKIPELYIQNALGGNISVVYEYYECTPRLGDKTVRDYTTKMSKYTSWVLWLSDISFVE